MLLPYQLICSARAARVLRDLSHSAKSAYEVAAVRLVSYSVARRIRIVSAPGSVVRIGCGSGHGGRSRKGSASVESPAPRRPAGDAGKGKRCEGTANDVDKDRSRSIGSRKIAFEYVDIESQLVAFEPGRLQHDDGVDHRRSVFLEAGNCGVRRIFREIVAAVAPVLDDSRREIV